jgi:putative ATP-dependent DNA ligase
MDTLAYFERVETTADSPAALFGHFQERSADGREYYVLPAARDNVERGTNVLIDPLPDGQKHQRRF